MAKNIIITVNAKSNGVKVNTEIVGAVGENMQGLFIVDFEDGVVNGACFLEIESAGEKGYIELSPSGKIYTAPIKSGVTKYSGNIKAQVRITQTAVGGEIPVFKSDIFNLNTLASINSLNEIPDEYPDWIDVANSKIAEINNALSEVQGMQGKSFVKQFTKTDFTQVGVEQKYFIAIKKAEHGLTKPYVDKVLVNSKADDVETTTFQTSVAVGEKTLSTGTIKIYITIDLSKYTEYSGTIYLKGE